MLERIGQISGSDRVDPDKVCFRSPGNGAGHVHNEFGIAAKRVQGVSVRQVALNVLDCGVRLGAPRGSDQRSNLVASFDEGADQHLADKARSSGQSNNATFVGSGLQTA